MYKNFKMTFDYRFVENDNAVICFVTPTYKQDEMMRYWALANLIRGEMSDEDTDIMCGNIEFKGIARYKTGDTNDKELAKEIARSKAVRRAFKAYRNVAQHCFDVITGEAFDLCGFMNSITKKIDKVQNEIEEYTQK